MTLPAFGDLWMKGNQITWRHHFIKYHFAKQSKKQLERKEQEPRDEEQEMTVHHS